jgi:hypothetical protein
MANRLSFEDLIKQNNVGWQALTPFFKGIGVDEYREASGNNEGGDQVYSQAPTAEALQRAQGYTFDWQDTGAANTGTLTAYDPSGNQLGGYRQQDKTAGQTLGNWAKVAAMAVPGLGAMGIGPMGGLLGGAGFGASEAAGLAGAGADAATSAAWANGAAGLGGDTLTAMGMGETGAGTLGATGLNTMRAGELAGYATNGAMPSSAASAGGGLLDSAMGAAGTAGQWMKDNPMLGKLLMSGGMSLASAGGGGSSAPAPKTYGPAQQWSSPIQQGLLSNPQQINPAAITQQRPAGLLAQGQQNDGAWRFLGGK